MRLTVELHKALFGKDKIRPIALKKSVQLSNERSEAQQKESLDCFSNEKTITKAKLEYQLTHQGYILVHHQVQKK